MTRHFAPGATPGHWGLDFATPEGTAVRPAAPGTVTFAGAVAGMLSVTVHHGAGLRTSYSFLRRIEAAPGAPVTTRSLLGLSGSHGQVPSLHWSLRLNDHYLDPEPWLHCIDPAAALQLLSASQPAGGVGYPPVRATRHLRRHL